MINKNWKICKLAIMTSGGDSPGMNAAIRAVAKTSVINNIQPFVIYEGFKGLCNNKISPANIHELDKFISRGGTHIYSSRYPNFKDIKEQEKAIEILKSNNIDAVIVIGGDGSYKGAFALHKLGVSTIAIPGTIDNDIPFTDTTIGFDSAINIVVETIDVIRNTAQSHKRLVIIETMGRGCPDITIFAGLATGAEAIITSENILNIDDFIRLAKKARKNGKRSIIFIVSELIYGLNGLPTLKEIAKIIGDKTNIDTRTLVVGHLQRGAIPTAIDRVWATKFGIHAVNALMKGKSGIAIGNKGEIIIEKDINAKDDGRKRKQHHLLMKMANKINIK